MKLTITASAKADLSAIRSYVRERNPAEARRIGQRLLQACLSLRELPDRGAPGLVAETRENASVWPYVIVYRVERDEVQILRIWHGAQDRS